MRVVSAVVWALFAVAFAAAAAYLAWFTIGTSTVLAYLLVVVFGFGAVIAARSARESFAARARDRATG